MKTNFEIGDCPICGRDHVEGIYISKLRNDGSTNTSKIFICKACMPICATCQRPLKTPENQKLLVQFNDKVSLDYCECYENCNKKTVLDTLKSLIDFSQKIKQTEYIYFLALSFLSVAFIKDYEHNGLPVFINNTNIHLIGFRLLLCFKFMVMFAWFVLFIIFYISLLIRRLNDIKISKNAVWLLLVPVVNSVFPLLLYFIPTKYPEDKEMNDFSKKLILLIVLVFIIPQLLLWVPIIKISSETTLLLFVFLLCFCIDQSRIFIKKLFINNKTS